MERSITVEGQDKEGIATALKQLMQQAP